MNPNLTSSPKETTRKKPVKNAVARVSHFTERRESEHAITVGRSPAQVFSFWRDLSNLALFMKDISSIEMLSSQRSKWTAILKSGLTAEWIAEITEEVPNELISWTTIEGEVKSEGTVRFLPAPAGLGTVVSLSVDYEIPGGKLAELATLFTGESPELLILTNLKRLKCFLETGEISTTEGQPSGREELTDSKSHSLH